MTEPIATIVIPCHNHRLALWECLYSINQQNCPWPFTVLVVDDASSDHPEEVCAEFGVNYLRVDFRNPAATRNAGLSQVKTPFVVFFDADNRMHENFMAAHLEPLVSDRADVVYGRRQFIQDADEVEGFFSVHSEYPISLEGLKLGPQIDTACAARCDRLATAPWDETLGRFEDWDFHLTNMERGLRYHFIDEPLFVYRVHHYTPERPYRNEMVNRRSLIQLRQKHALATSGRAVVTIAIPLMGREYAITELLDCLLKLDYPREQLNILFVDDSNDMDFWRRHIKPFIRDYVQDYAGIGAAPLYDQEHYFDLPERIEDQGRRYEKIGQIMRRIGGSITTPYVLVLEDDTICPPDTINKLLAALSADDSNVLAQGIERSRVVKYAIGAWQFNQSGVWQNLYWQRPEVGVTRVGAGGFYCLMAKSDWFTQFDFPPSIEHQKIGWGGPDIACGRALLEQGLNWVTDWSVQCDHLVLTPKGQRYRLSLKDFSEPKCVFRYDYLGDEQYVSERVWLQPSPAVDLERGLTVILHQVASLDQVGGFLTAAGLMGDRKLNLVLIPRDQAAYNQLVTGNFLPGTILKKPGRLADAINQALRVEPTAVYLVIARADILPPAYLRRRCETQVTAASSVVVAEIGDRLFWDGQSITTKPAYHHKRLINFDLLLLYVPGQIWPWVQPRLAGYSTLQAWAFSWQLHKSSKNIQSLNNCVSVALPSWQNEKLQSGFYYHLGILFGMEVPIKRWLSFWRRNGKRWLKGNFWAQLQFHRGVLHDVIMRWRDPTKRRLR